MLRSRISFSSGQWLSSVGSPLHLIVPHHKMMRNVCPLRRYKPANSQNDVHIIVRIYNYRCEKDPEVLAHDTEDNFACSISETMSAVIDFFSIYFCF
jgi:hypothetical protein